VEHDPIRGVRLTAALLDDADARDADLSGSSLCQADILPRSRADLTGVRYDVRVRWPAGYGPARHGAVDVR
jgi:Pentapeptide repeats (8 copies)